MFTKPDLDNSDAKGKIILPDQLKFNRDGQRIYGFSAIEIPLMFNVHVKMLLSMAETLENPNFMLLPLE